jgi:hypothetical protein
MNHHEAIKLLVEFADGTLDGVTSDEIGYHVNACDDCQGWLRTFALVSHTPEGSTHRSHPDSLELAACAVRPEDEFEPDHLDLRSHLSWCGTCRQILEAVRRAVAQARPAAESRAASPSTPARTTTWWWTAAAAMGVIGLAVGAIVGTGISPRMTDGATSDDRAVVAAVATAPGVPAVSHASIDGERLIQAEGPITIVNTSISPGASVTIQARRGVAFGNGFQVSSGTRIEVGAFPEHEDDTIQNRKGGPNEKS